MGGHCHSTPKCGGLQGNQRSTTQQPSDNPVSKNLSKEEAPLGSQNTFLLLVHIGGFEWSFFKPPEVRRGVVPSQTHQFRCLLLPT